jgi:hypothetical protein
MRRLLRESFLQKHVYPLFGYYPWECPLCRKPVLLKVRRMRKRRSKLTDFSAIDARAARTSHHASAPAGKAQ